MKTIPSILAVLLAIILSHSKVVRSEDIVFEMGESGETLSFVMTAEESARISPRKKMATSADENQRWTKKFEMGDSGTILEFPMTENEIALLQSRRLKEMITLPQQLINQQVVEEVFEMADGQTITFKKEGNKGTFEYCLLCGIY